jgi:hypothetical protein
MAYVMTKQGSANCAHSGTTTLQSSSKLKVSGSPVIVSSDVSTWSISGCAQTDTAHSQVQCATYMSFNGKASKLKVNGEAVVLDTFSGTTNGKPDSSSAPASAGQSKLQAT